MTEMRAGGLVVRIEKGDVTDEELAAVIATLLVRAAPAARPAERRREPTRWRRREYRVGRCDPRSWRAVDAV